jgi:hypothetical protein
MVKENKIPLMFLAIGALGVWSIFHGLPVEGSVIYIVGTVLGVWLWNE